MAAVLLVSFILVQIIYRLFWSPLARFALTFAYEFYFDVWKPGMFVWEIKRLHQIYGNYKSNFENPIRTLQPRLTCFDRSSNPY